MLVGDFVPAFFAAISMEGPEVAFTVVTSGAVGACCIVV
jgi:hypothetical protein